MGKKFESKCQTLYAHEDEMLAKMQDIIKPYNEELNKQECEIVCRLVWMIKLSEDNIDVSNERHAIKRWHPYTCAIRLAFQYVGADPNDEHGFEISDEITSYYATWIGWTYRKYTIEWIVENAEKAFQLVKTKGLEEAQEYLRLNPIR